MGFYNLIWDPRYNVKIPVMQIIAICSLILIFNLNYIINYEFVNQLGNFSPYILGQPPQVAWIFALILSLFISVFPKMDKEFRMTISLGLIVIIIIFFLGGPLIAMIATWDMLEIGTALANSLIEFLKVLTVLLYWAPILLGVYGIIARNRVYLFISVLFFLGVIITTDLYFLSIQGAHTKTEDSIPMFIVFALSLLCYYEMSDSSITFYKLNESTRRREHYSPHQVHLERILQLYFVFFIIFSAMTLVFTWFILDFNAILKAIGSDQIAESVELNSIYGSIISLTVMVVFLIFLGYLIRYDDRFKAMFSRLKSLAARLLPGLAARFGRGEDDSEEVKELPPPPPAYRTPSSIEYQEERAHKIIIMEEP